jgi:hypothetical protein
VNRAASQTAQYQALRRAWCKDLALCCQWSESRTVFRAQVHRCPAGLLQKSSLCHVRVQAVDKHCGQSLLEMSTGRGGTTYAVSSAGSMCAGHGIYGTRNRCDLPFVRSVMVYLVNTRHSASWHCSCGALQWHNMLCSMPGVIGSQAGSCLCGPAV